MMADGRIITQLSIFVNNEPGRLAYIASVLKDCGINRPIGRAASDHDINESRKVLKRAGNLGISQSAVFPEKQFPEKYYEVLADMAIDTRGARHLVMETRQTKLI